MGGERKLTEQLYLAFYTWRARLDGERDQLDTDYLRSLSMEMQRADQHIEHELAARAAVRAGADGAEPARSTQT